MAHTLSAETISREDFDAALGRYDAHIPEALIPLDQIRFEDHPKMVAGRIDDDSVVLDNGERLLMDKEELVTLVEWKLKHGTFRPKLLQLVKSNDTADIRRIMRTLSVGDKSVKEKMKILTELKGIGPATASLILSCIDPLRYAFFSDELFRWIHWDGKNADGSSNGIKSGKGWTRSIGYTQKEYDSLIARCQAVQERLSGDGQRLNFLDLEKVAYVLGKEKVDIDVEPLATSEEKAEVKTTAASKRSRTENDENTTETKRKRQKSGSKTASRETRKGYRR